MCGIAGVYSLSGKGLPDFDDRAVLRSIQHRGPDGEGTFRRAGVFLGATRLAIIDPAHGKQPVSDESGRFHLVMNGEIYDYDLLITELQNRGHRFRSRCDTEVAVHLFEEYWDGALERIDGQFALAVYDGLENRLLLARDRMGISPLFYAVVDDYLVFGSEAKAIFATGLVRAEINPRSLDAILAFGCVPTPGTVFRGIKSLAPGKFMEVKNGVISERRFWDIPYPDAGNYPDKSVRRWSREFREVLHYACQRRLKADVPVGLYLSGGIDSATVAEMVGNTGDIRKRVFTIGFPEPGFDESQQTKRLAAALGIRAHLLIYRQEDLAEDLPKLIYHGETPLVTTESVPLMALSKLAAKYAKVVLTGEGSDEALGGYAYFRWDALKERVGHGLWRKVLLLATRARFRRIFGEPNPFIPRPRDYAWAQELFGCYPSIMVKLFYFRMIREMVYSEEMLARQRNLSDTEFLDLPLEKMRRWDQLNRTLYISSRVFLTNHLLGSHGDRALMANSVEGRYPFLDRRVQEFLTTVPPGIKTRWHTDKYLLRRTMSDYLPTEVIRREKKPFLAPFGTPFVGDGAPEYIRWLLSPRKIVQFGYFDPAKVQRIAGALEAIKESLARDRQKSLRLNNGVIKRTVLGMAMNFVVSTQVLADLVSRGKFAPNGVHHAPN